MDRPKRVLGTFNRVVAQKGKFYRQEDFFTGEIIQAIMSTFSLAERKIDFRGLKKYQISALFFEMLIFRLVKEDKKSSWWFEIELGNPSDGSKLKPLVRYLCKQVYGIDSKEEEKGVSIKITADTASRIKLIQEMKSTLDKLVQFRGRDQPEKRLIMGFARAGCPELVTKYWTTNPTDQDKAELVARVWPVIVNMFSKRFIQAIKDSNLSEEDPATLDQLKKLYEEKPQSWEEAFAYCKEKESFLSVVHTFSECSADMDLGSEIKKVHSPAISEIRELLECDKHLALVYDEIRDDTEQEPLTKKLRAVQGEVEKYSKKSRHCFIILCLCPESEALPDYMPFNQAWTELMVDNLRKQEEKH